MDGHQLLIAVVVGAAVGLASGAFGKGGSSLATPLLAAAGIPAIVAVASPLPATIPSTALAGHAYARAGHLDWRIVRIGVAAGLPVAAAGAFLTRWIPGAPLVLASEILVLGLALRMLVAGPEGDDDTAAVASSDLPLAPIVVTVIAVAFVSGLLANAGGFLLAPLFAGALHMPLKRALGTSLGISVALAVPGTIVHALLGHIDWPLTIAFGLASVPFARLGAHLSIRSTGRHLARSYGIVLTLASGTALLLTH